MDGKIALEEHWAVEETLHTSVKLVGEGDYWNDVQRRLLDVEDVRLAEMDRHGIEMTILSLNSPGVQSVLDVPAAIDLAQRMNDVLAEKIAKHPDRFAGFAALPLQDPDAAIEELTRCVKDLDFKGALVNGFTQKEVPDSAIYYDSPEYRPFWAALQDLDVPFYLHPRITIPSRAQAYDGHPWLASPVWDFAVQTSIHAMRLIGARLFDEYPRLQIILGHLGERIPYDMWRLDNLMKKVPAGYPAQKPVGEYLRANFHLTTSGQFHDPTFQCALAEMGVERLMFSIDYPFEVTAEAASWFDSTDLPEAARYKIGRGNAVDLFKLSVH